MQKRISYYRIKKIVDVTEGQQHLFEDNMYYFYITNILDRTPEECLKFIHGRCNHENKIEQIANGIYALKMPAAEFNANWAYMIIASLAWNIKCFIGMLIPDKITGSQIIASEFKSFQNKLIQIPCQIIRTGRRIVCRFLNCSKWVEIIFQVMTIIKRLDYSKT